MGSAAPSRPARRATYDFLVSRSAVADGYGVWRFDPDAPELLTPHLVAEGARFDRNARLTPIGDYLLAWGPFEPGDDDGGTFPWRLLAFDPTKDDPLNATALRSGSWDKTKFWGSHRSHYTSAPDEARLLQLLPTTSFVLALILGEGRGTYELWNFDPQARGRSGPDPLPQQATWQEAFHEIRVGHELIPAGNYVLHRLPDGGGYRLWSFDPQAECPLPSPPVAAGRWETIDANHRLVVVGDHVLDWVPGEADYRLWRLDPHGRDPLVGPVRQGRLPATFTADTTLTAVQPRLPIEASRRDVPGTIDFMRSRIKHVVYYTLESRSFDSVCGWLYENGVDGVHFVGPEGPFEGASEDNYNLDGDIRVHQSKYNGGVPSEEVVLSTPAQDPFHGNADTLDQMFYDRDPGYRGRARPDMGGFVRNNASADVMETFTPAQVPVLNGLARHFGISDAWFCSVPGGTDINRAFAVTGSCFSRLNTWEGGDAYEYWTKNPHRQSLWKVLWSNGITDWRIYNAIEWKDHVFTYHLYLEGQVPSVDANVADFVAPMERFEQDAKSGSLPSFSFLELVWIAPTGTTSYHPGASLVPGEKALNRIYDALRTGPAWDETLLVVTFSKNGGVYDHVPPPYARKPWPLDENQGFQYDLMGPRVPAIVVSPYVKEKTVFRAEGPTPFDATSFAATLLDWYGVPRARWGLGDRIVEAPTFEGVFQEERPRTDAPTLEPPTDKQFPKK